MRECDETAAFEEWKAERLDELQEEFYKKRMFSDVLLDDDSASSLLDAAWKAIKNVKDCQNPQRNDYLAARAMRNIMESAAKTYALKTFEKEVRRGKNKEF
jgi:hypothetical protein